MSTVPPPQGFDHRTVVIGTAFLMAGNVLGQLVSLAGLLFISRIYVPADVGLWAMFLGIGFMVPLLAGLRYELAVIIVDPDEDAARLVNLTLAVSAVCALAVQLLVWGLETVPGLIPDGWSAICYAYVPYILFNGILNAGTGWAIRKNMFAALMFMRIAQPLVTLVLQYVFKDSALYGNGLIFGTVGGCVLTVIPCIWILWAPVRAGFAGGGSLAGQYARLKAAAAREKSFPLFSVPYSIVGNFANQAVVVALGAWYSLSVVGFFNMAFRTLNAPMMLIGSALGQAIMPALSRVKTRIAAYEHVIVSFLRFLGWIHIPALVFIIVHGRAAYSFVFGAQWAQAGYYAAILTMALFGLALTQWFERIFDILGRQKLHLIVSLGLNGLVLVIFLAAHWMFSDPAWVIAAWSAGGLIYGVLWIAIVFRLCGFHMGALVRVGLELGGLAVVTAGLSVWTTAISGYAAHVAAIAALFGAYGFFAWLFLKKDFERIFQWKTAQ